VSSVSPPTDSRASAAADPAPPAGNAPNGNVPEGNVPGDAPTGKPALTRDDVAHLAHLARLEVTDAELDLYVGQLSVILDSVAAVSEVAASEDIAPTTHAVPLTNVYREDVVVPGLSQQDALSGAPAAEDGRFRVPQILGEEQ
jgi:aspartyl-tRNA(Asn)/glutamyl-tRNA(Gln) amidotransferase subunit C